ncbi:MAG: NAD(P)-dependent oxidoreductase [Ilumatobacteraceae bacterium]|nr:NAD(P)-dependent oxidoreductase [Ilumatobacteraceae bacterium]
MLTDEKILITGPAGQIGYPLVQFLAPHNEVWGVARFSEPGSREKVESQGITTRVVDLSAGDYSELPDDFTYVIHLAAFKTSGLDYDGAVTVNAEGTGLLLQHCHKAKAALVMSTQSVYKPVEDPFHAFVETDPLGDANYIMSPTYSVSKISQEAVARYCARSLQLPVTIARMNASYGPNGGLPAYHMDWIVADQPVVTRWDPCPYSLIHQDDINNQLEALLDAGSVPATIVNWSGDEAVTVQQWCTYMGDLSGHIPDVRVTEVPGSLRGSVSDITKRFSITGPCDVSWQDGIRRTYEQRHIASGAQQPIATGQSNALFNAYTTLAKTIKPQNWSG